MGKYGSRSQQLNMAAKVKSDLSMLLPKLGVKLLRIKLPGRPKI